MLHKAFVFLAKCIIAVKWKSGELLYYLQYLQMCAPFQLYDFPTIRNINQQHFSLHGFLA